ncbi:MAG: hypothetical protein ACLTCP_07635 [Ruminococcus bicirculans (ex Wegman et al. 2014)]
MGKEKGWISCPGALLTIGSGIMANSFQGQVWIDLLLSANHEDRKIMFDGKPLLVNEAVLLPLNTSLLTSGTGRHKVSLF